VRGVGGDQPLLLERPQRRVDRAGAGLPGGVRPLRDRRDDAVAVARLLGEQREDRPADVAAPAAAGAAETAAGAAEAGTETGTESRAEATTLAPLAPSAAEAAAVRVRVATATPG